MVRKVDEITGKDGKNLERVDKFINFLKENEGSAYTEDDLDKKLEIKCIGYLIERHDSFNRNSSRYKYISKRGIVKKSAPVLRTQNKEDVITIYHGTSCLIDRYYYYDKSKDHLLKENKKTLKKMFKKYPKEFFKD